MTGQFPRDFPRRGEIYEVDFEPTRGSEQGGRRPAVVVSSDVLNRNSSVVTVCPLTSKQVMKRCQYSSCVFVPAGDLPQDSAILCAQILTVSHDRIYGYYGSLDDTRRVNLNRALTLVLNLPRP